MFGVVYLGYGSLNPFFVLFVFVFSCFVFVPFFFVFFRFLFGYITWWDVYGDCRCLYVLLGLQIYFLTIISFLFFFGDCVQRTKQTGGARWPRRIRSPAAAWRELRNGFSERSGYSFFFRRFSPITLDPGSESRTPAPHPVRFLPPAFVFNLRKIQPSDRPLSFFRRIVSFSR